MQYIHIEQMLVTQDRPVVRIVVCGGHQRIGRGCGSVCSTFRNPLASFLADGKRIDICGSLSST